MSLVGSHRSELSPPFTKGAPFPKENDPLGHNERLWVKEASIVLLVKGGAEADLVGERKVAFSPYPICHPRVSGDPLKKPGECRIFVIDSDCSLPR
jgi:hypothetical protein